jgi:hypothetical protein
MIGTSRKPRSNQISILFRFVNGWENAIVSDQLEISAPRFEVLRLDLGMRGRDPRLGREYAESK